MHELGHNFGLEHGGVIPNPTGLWPPEGCFAWKPNYISVMNYRDFYGIPYAATPGSSTPVDWRLWRLDYSRYALATLNETDLNEFLGVGGLRGDTDIVTYCTPLTCGLRGPSFGRIDWNNDGVIEAHVAVDIDGNPVGAPQPFPLHGFHDWTYVKQQLQIPPDVIDNLPKRAVR